MCALILQLLSKTFLILPIQGRTAINVKSLHVKYLLFLSDLKELEFLDRFSKKNLNQISSKSVRWEQNCSMQPDGHDEADNLSSQFGNSLTDIVKNNMLLKLLCPNATLTHALVACCHPVQ